MKTRNDLIKEIKNLIWVKCHAPNESMESVIADFIIEDRKRICGPLLIAKNKDRNNYTFEKRYFIYSLGLDESIEIAGLSPTKEDKNWTAEDILKREA